MNNLIRVLQYLFILTISICSQNKDFYFVQITDTHWGDADNLNRTKSIIDAINNVPLNLEFVIHTGDCTAKKILDQSVVDSGLAIMKSCKVPVYYIPGNNDITEKKFKEESDAFVKNFGSLNRRIEKNNISLITLFNVDIKDSSGKQLNDPLKNLDSLLNTKGSDLPVLLFQHCPNTEDYYANVLHPGWPEDRVKQFQKMCETHKVQGIFSGHFHKDELHWVGGIPLFTAPPVSGAWGRQASFRVYHYENGKISYFSQYL